MDNPSPIRVIETKLYKVIIKGKRKVVKIEEAIKNKVKKVMEDQGY